jgi:hypothetical protein
LNKKYKKVHPYKKEVLFMLRKLKHITVIILFISIVSYGFIKVSSELPQFIKERSLVKVTYISKPFDLSLDIGDYIIYVNSNSMSNIKNAAVNVFKNIAK